MSGVTRAIASILSFVPPGISSATTELYALLTAHYADYLPWFLFYTWLHLSVEYLLPYAWPSVYDVLTRKDARKATEQGLSYACDRAGAARVARNAAVQFVMAVHVSVASLYGLATLQSLQSDLYGATDLTRHLVTVAVGFFVWDSIAVVLDRRELQYIVHGFVCLFVFVGALHPFLHFMACVTLLFELSTPFLKIRELMIASDATGGSNALLFNVVNWGFALFFFLSRIVSGYYYVIVWWFAIERLIASGGIHSVPIARMYQVFCVLLTGLNTFWFYVIVKNAFARSPKEKPT